MPKVQPVAVDVAEVASACRANVAICFLLDSETPGEVLGSVLALGLPV